MRVSASIFALILAISVCDSAKAQISEGNYDLPEPVSSQQADRGVVYPADPFTQDIKTRAVIIHSQQGCGTCKVLARNLAEIEAAPPIPGLDFVTLNYDKKSEELFFASAYSMGVGEAVAEWAGKKIKPGTLLIVDLDRQQVVLEIKHNARTSAIEEELRRYAR